MTRPERDIVAVVRAQFRSAPPPRLGIAVSGGGDSIALLHILAECFPNGEAELFTATVDHGLRPEAAAEAAAVAETAAALGLSHTTLKWNRPQESGNLQEQAREGRYALLTAWARDNDIPVVALGHTADDQAETVVMRLKRASGVSGLAAMPFSRTLDGITLLRPLLEITRARLRSYLMARGATWIEDPSNEDEQFERVRVRKALEVLQPLGVTIEALSAVARHMESARDALDWYTFLAAREIAHVEAGAVVLDQRQFRALPDETARRLVSGAIQWITGAGFPPRRVPLAMAVDAGRRGGAATLAGCRVLTRARQIWICREFQAVQKTQSAPGQVWDQRWRFYGGGVDGCEVRALTGEGLLDCPGWRETGRPGPVLEATPALWRGSELVAAPLAGMDNGWTAELTAGGEEFFASLLSH